MAASKTSLLDEIFVNLLLMFSGMFFSNAGGWLLCLSNVTPPLPQSRAGCNCRKKNECPLEGQCLQTNVVYQATVTSETSTESYVGLATNFKERYRNHNASFRHTSKKNGTELSKHIWTLKDAN